MSHTFVGFGFGPIQSGLFLLEAWRSQRFDRLVVAEIASPVVSALRAAGGACTVNVALADRLDRPTVPGIEIFNPADAADREQLVAAVAEAHEIATALPSVAFYGGMRSTDPASILAEGFRRRAARHAPSAAIYAAENDIEAAQKLRMALCAAGAPAEGWFCLNTVIGKMSAVVEGRAILDAQGLAPFVPDAERAFRVEAFNRVLVDRVPVDGFCRLLDVFVEKAQLRPFEEAKLYGHNAAHALLGYHLAERGAVWMSDAREDADLMERVRRTFLEESGGALCRKFDGVDPLFTPSGYAAYVEDLMQRMTNPWLRDSVERIIRDPARKLGWDDRLIGTIRLALSQGILPRGFAEGARLALAQSHREMSGTAPREWLQTIWARNGADHPAEADRVLSFVLDALHFDRSVGS